MHAAAQPETRQSGPGVNRLPQNTMQPQRQPPAQHGALRPRDARDRLIVALDLAAPDMARAMVAQLGDSVTFYKIGMQLVFTGGLPLVSELREAGKRVFLDMKLLDIDNTISNGVRSIANLDVNLTTIHAYPQAMRAAVAARGDRGPGLLGVTALTSMDDKDLHAAGYRDGVAALVEARAEDARRAGMDGIVCSAAEAARVRAIAGSPMVIVTPGIRPRGAAAGDQKRVFGPADAVAAGADYIVVGRPVTAAGDPAGSAQSIVAEIEAAL